MNIVSNNIRRLYYGYNDKGLMTYRSDSISNQRENFTYDNLQRLSSATKLNGSILTNRINGITYANNGNILTKDDAGTYSYDATVKPNAITELNNALPNTEPSFPVLPGMPLLSSSNVVTYLPPFFNTISTETLHTKFNTFNRIDTITQGNKELTFTYNPYRDRIKTVYKENNTIQKTKYFVGDYECEVSANGNLRELLYVTTPSGATIINVKETTGSTTTDSLYYILKDHLGSYDVVVNQRGVIRECYSFDAWGNRRLATNWQTKDVATTRLFDRGFTGHEHLDKFEIINMNGRLYDPVIARFLSPDNYVVDNTFTQDFNRYTYARNNPLMYTDPDGEWIHIVIGAVVGGVMNWAANGAEFTWDGLLYFGVGAVAGAAGAWAGGAVAAGLGQAANLGQAIGYGALSNGVGAAAGGFASGTGNAWIGGASFGNGLLAGLQSGLIGGVTGGLLGGISGGVSYHNQNLIFRRGIKELGVDAGDPVPATDAFLRDAQKAWFPDAPMDKVKAFTVENVPPSTQKNMDTYGGAGATVAGKTESGILTGYSEVYFNKNLAFSSAKQLFYTMGHEFVHVSQYAALVGEKFSEVKKFFPLLDLAAYNYEVSLGGRGITIDQSEIARLAHYYSQFPNSIHYQNFDWTLKHYFKYPF